LVEQAGGDYNAAVRCWSETCGVEVDERAAACPSCGALLRVRDQYRIVRHVGQGSMGVVYEAIDEPLGRTVAVKIMHGRQAAKPPKRDRFYTECKAMAALDHPGIARIHAADSHHGQLFFVQEFVRGPSLKHHIAELSKRRDSGYNPDVAFAVRVALELLDALGHAHGQGIVHRDVNPNNVLMVERQGESHPVLIDFGMARVVGQEATKVAWGGTPGFAAPEQILDPQSNDARSDLYAVGAVTYALLSAGQRPYGELLYKGIGRQPQAMLKAYDTIAQGGTALRTPASPERGVSEALAETLARALAPNCEDRYQSAAQMTAALEAARACPAQPAKPHVSASGKVDTLDLEPGQPRECAKALPFSPPEPTAKLWTEDGSGPAPGGSDPSAESPPETSPLPPTNAAAAVEAATAQASDWQSAAAPRGDGQAEAAPSAPRTKRRLGLWVLAGGVVVLAVAGAIVAMTRHGSAPRTDPSARPSAALVASGTADAAVTATTVQAQPFFLPGGIDIGADGAIYVADQGNHRIQVVRDGQAETLAGSTIEGFDDGPALDARFSLPRSVAVSHSDQAVYVADRGNHRVRQIRDGRVTTLAGGFEAGYLDGPAQAARFQDPEGVAIAADGAVLVADAGNHCLRRIKDGEVSTLAGRPQPGYVDGPLGQARFSLPSTIDVAADGTIYLVDAGNRRVRAIVGDRVSTIATFAGQAQDFVEAVSARFVRRPALAVGPGGLLYLATPDRHRIWTIVDGQLEPFAGMAKPGSVDDYGPRAQFESPEGLAVAPDGGLYVSDSADGALRLVRDGKVSTVLRSTAGGFAEGDAAKARFDGPLAVALKDDALLVADWQNRRVRQVEDAKVSTLAGSGEEGSFDGAAPVSQFASPWDLAVHRSGVVYVADRINHRIRAIEGGRVRTFAGGNAAGARNGLSLGALFRAPEGIDVDGDGVVYVADTGNHRIRVIEGGQVRTLAGSGEPGFENGDVSTAKFLSPGGLTVGRDGAVYVADTGNHCVRVIREGRVTGLAGTGEPGFADGQQDRARFEAPLGIAWGKDGVVVVADSGNHRIRVIKDGVVATVAGSGEPGFANGPALEAAFAQPADVAQGPGGEIYVADAGNHLIRIIRQGRVETLAGR